MKDLSEVGRPPELSGAGLLLRPLRAADKAAVVQACNDRQVERWCFRIPYPYHDEDFDAFLAIARRSWHRERSANWVVADAGSRKLLGMISLDVKELRQSGEIGYWTAPWARGRHVMSAAARLVRDWAVADLGLERLELTTDVDNVASQRTAESIGFRREGIMRGYLTCRGVRRDSVLYGLLPADEP